jgi:hypothetical protein
MGLGLDSRAFTLRLSQFRTKKEYSFPPLLARPSLRTLASLKRDYVQVTEIGKPCGPPRDATSRKPQGQAGAVRFNGTKCKPGPDLFIYVPEWLQT